MLSLLFKLLLMLLVRVPILGTNIRDRFIISIGILYLAFEILFLIISINDCIGIIIIMIDIMMVIAIDIIILAIIDIIFIIFILFI